MLSIANFARGVARQSASTFAHFAERRREIDISAMREQRSERKVPAERAS